MIKFLVAFLFFSFPFMLNGQNNLEKITWEKAQKREHLTNKECVLLANLIHKCYITFDSHNDTAIWINNPDGEYTVKKDQVSFPLMKIGGLDGAFFAIYLESGRRDDKSLDSVYNYALTQIEKFKRYVAKNESVAEVAYSIEDVVRLKKEGKRAVVFALENAYGIGRDLNKIDTFYNAGVRYITLCHNADNDVCDSGVDSYNTYGGLSEFGVKAVKKMNDIGMMIDISHVSTNTVMDVLKVSKSPIIASHSAVRKLKNLKRNLTDNEIKAIAEKGGVIQIASGKYFLSSLPDRKVNVKHLADHIDYVKNLVGVDYIGIGTDFDGGGGVVGLENCAKMKNLTIELLKRGYTPLELKKFWGGNLFRVWREVVKNKID